MEIVKKKETMLSIEKLVLSGNAAISVVAGAILLLSIFSELFSVSLNGFCLILLLGIVGWWIYRTIKTRQVNKK